MRFLCLSSGDRPSECKPSLERYFIIKHKKRHRTIDARRNFLNIF
ncbi:TrbM/KikA/MpfK family conjugal transfer protein, partial [Kingella kingae]